MIMAKPTIIFVPGFWEGPTIFSAIASTLETKHGYPTKILSLASTGTAPPHAKTLTEDVDGIARGIEEVINKGKEVILVMHSAGGFIGSQAVRGTGSSERKAKGEVGGVNKLVFLAGGAFPEGTEHKNQQLFFDIQVSLIRFFTVRVYGYSTTKGDRMYPVSPLTTMFNDFPVEEAEIFIKDHLSYQPASGWADTKITYCGWRHIPSIYLVCENDALLPPPFQRQCVELIGAETLSCTASHMVVLSQPEKVVEIVRKAAGEVIDV